MTASKIEWTRGDDGTLGYTWNPIRGCSRVSAGCDNCYAERIATRFSGQGQLFEGFAKRVHGQPHWTGRVELVPEKLNEPLRWRKSRRVFVNSMSDLLHEALPDEAIDRVFATMLLGSQHTFQLLTKRAERLRRYCGSDETLGRLLRLVAELTQDSPRPSARVRHKEDGFKGFCLPNVWLGVSVENPSTAHRIEDLLATPAAVRFVSYEPALAPVDWMPWLSAFVCPECGPGVAADQDGFCACCGADCKVGERVDWLIVGGESGPGARPFDLAWARSAIEQCRAAGVACFVKQLGRHPYTSACALKLRDPKGGDPAEWPEDLQVREFPR